MAAHPRLAALVVLALAACTDQPAPTLPGEPLLSRGPAAAAGPALRRVEMQDRCEPTSFNAAVGPGTCIGEGRITFEQLIARLQKKQRHEAWRFAPERLHVDAGTALAVLNTGGEVHTFTRVASFGGGIVPVLNDLSGTPVPAPECLALAPADFIPAGGATTLATGAGTPLAAGEHRFQCCIHPWMRSTATVREHH